MTRHACAALVRSVLVFTVGTVTAAIGFDESSSGGIAAGSFQAFGRIGSCPFGATVLVPDNGDRVALSDALGAQIGDFVFVSGSIIPNTAVICDFAAGGMVAIPLLQVGTIAPGYRGAGDVLAGPDECLVFQTADGEWFALSDPGSFSIGAAVFVQGLVDESPTGCPPLNLPTLNNDYIGALVRQTGRLIVMNACTQFQTEDGQRFELENTSQTGFGDWLTVEGGLESPCSTCCDPFVARIRLNTKDFAYVGRGSLIETPGCGLAFEPINRPFMPGLFLGGALALENVGGFNAGAFVFVTGRIDDECDFNPACFDGCLSGNSIGPAFADCGTFLTNGDSCVVFHADNGQEFVLEHGDGFAAGQRVFVSGAVADGGPCETGGSPELARNSVDLCVDGCGQVEHGFECTPLFLRDLGGAFFLQDLGGFEVGDYVAVKGALLEECLSLCPFSCIGSPLIASCIPGDHDGDADVDLLDLGEFVDCITGPGGGLPLGCGPADLETDADVDMADFITFLQVFGGGS